MVFELGDFWKFINSPIFTTLLIILCMVYLARLGVERALLNVVNNYLKDRKEQDDRIIKHNIEERRLKALGGIIELLDVIINNPDSNKGAECAVRLERFVDDLEPGVFDVLSKKWVVINSSIENKRAIEIENLKKVRDDLNLYLIKRNSRNDYT